MSTGFSQRRLSIYSIVLLSMVFASPLVAENSNRHGSHDPLDCNQAYASPPVVTPHPYQRFSSVRIKGIHNVKRTKVLCIKQDEARESGEQPDAYGVGRSYAHVRRTRLPSGDGRTYHLGFKAWGWNGEQCTGSVSVQVPLNAHTDVVDGGPLYDSVSRQSDCSTLIANQPPDINSIPVVEVNVASQYRYALEAEDANNDPLKYQLDQSPQGMHIDAAGVITWTPTTEQVGRHPVSASVEDGINPPVIQQFEVTVQPIGQCTDDTESTTVSLNGFNASDDWSLLGDSRFVTVANQKQRLRLTTRTSHKTGATYYNRPISLSDDQGAAEPFSLYFRMQMHSPSAIREHDGKGADGIAFLLTADKDQLGSDGGRLGYAGINNSVAIEFDTWQNAWDSNGNHIGINLNGELNSLKTTRLQSRINNGRIKHVWIDYQPDTQLLSIRYANNRHKPIRPILWKTVDLRSILQSDKAFFGFTSATGDVAQIHDILSLRMSAIFANEDCDEEILQFTSVPPTQLTAGQTLRYDADATSSLATELLTYSLVTAPASATIDPRSGLVTWVSTLTDAKSTVAFTILVESDSGSTTEQAFIVSVLVPPNQVPVASNLDLTTDEDTDIAVVLQGHDSNGDALTYQLITQPAKGTFSGTAPNLIYRPLTNISGTDEFTYRVNDGQADSNTATVAITIASINDAPVAQAQSVEGIEDTALPVTLIGNDVEGDALTFSLNAQPSHGTLSGTAPNIVYTPNADYYGNDSFTFIVNDGTTSSAPATVSITVAGQNDQPIAESQLLTKDEDSPIIIQLVGTDKDGNALSYRITGSPAYGTLTGTAPNLVYTPSSNYSGSDDFTFVVNDGQLDSDSATVSIQINPVNDTPVASSQSLSLEEDTAASMTLSAFDVDGDTLEFAITNDPIHGVLSGSEANWVYTPNSDFYGDDSFRFRVNDGSEDSNTATVSLTVKAANDVPVSKHQSLTVNEDEALPILLAAKDADADSLSYQVTVPPTFGSISGDTPNIIYTPDPDYTGIDQFEFVSSDAESTSEVATIEITVNSVNDAPQSASQTLTTSEDTNVNITLSGTDADSDPLAYMLVDQPSNGTVNGNAENWVYEPNENFNGLDSFTYLVNDGQVDSGFATVTINVTPVNDMPEALPATYSLDENGSVNFSLTGNDVDGDSLEFTVTQPPANGTLIGIVPDLQYIPTIGFDGTDSLAFTVNDGHATSIEVSIVYVINAINHPPVVSSTVTQSALTGQLYEYNVVATDEDGDALFYTLGTPIEGIHIDDTGLLSWTPKTNQVGVHLVAIKVSDENGGEVTHSFELDVRHNEPQASHEGTDFWLTFMPNLDQTSDVLSVTISSSSGATGSIEIIATGKILPFSVGQNDATQVIFEHEDYAYITASRAVAGYENISLTGIHIESDNPISVYGLNQRKYSSDGFLALPTENLGQRYFPLSYDTQTHDASSQLAIVAAEDDTTVDIKLAFDWSGNGASYERDFSQVVLRGDKATKVLNRGEVYLVQEHISASEITSDKPIAVLSGNSCTSVHYNQALTCDHLVEQQIPAGAIGYIYYSVPFAHRKAGDRFMFSTTMDDTEITVNDMLVAQLDSGRVFETIIDGLAQIRSNHPIVVSQIAHSDGYDKYGQSRDFQDYALDPFMVNLTAEQHFLKNYTFSTPDSFIEDNFINVVIDTNFIDSIILDNAALSGVTFSTISGTSYSGAVIPVGFGRHTIEANTPFGIYIYGYADWDSYGYAGGLHYTDADKISTIELLEVDHSSPIVGSESCSRFKAIDNQGRFVAFATISVDVEGVNHVSDTVVTDASGIGAYCYSSRFSGQDTLSISAYNTSPSETTVQWIAASTEIPFAPLITQHPDLNLPLSEDYVSQIVAISSDSMNVTYSLLEAPSGMSIDGITGEINWANPNAKSSAIFAISISDGSNAETVQRYKLSAGLTNHDPIITSDPINTVAAGTQYIYELTLTDNDNHLLKGLTDTPRVHFRNRPDETMEGFFNSSNPKQYLIRWKAPLDQANTTHDVVIVMADRRGGYDEQSFVLEVTENLPIIINSNPTGTTRVGRRYSYYPDYTDPENQYRDSFKFNLISGPQGFRAGKNYLYWTPTVDQIGDHTISYSIEDNAGNVTTQTYTLTVVDEPNVAPQITSTPASSIGAGYEYLYQLTATDADNDTLRFDYSGTLPPGASFSRSTGILKWTPTTEQLGHHAITLTVNDSYETVNHAFNLRVVEDTTAPTVEIGAPGTMATITTSTEIQGLVSDENLLEWRLELSRIGSGDSEVLASGTDSFGTQTLVSIDPSLMINGLYEVFLIATDVSRSQTVKAITLKVDGNLKVGNFSFSVVDFDIELDGIPIQVTRTYDTRQRDELGAFGYGWTIDYQNVEIQESRKPGEGWQMSQYASGPLGVLTDYCAEPISDIEVTVRLPNDKLESFAVSAEPHCTTGAPINDVNLVFTAQDGTTSTLESLSDETYRYYNGTLNSLGDASIADPDTYQLTTQSGYVYQLDQSFGIRTVSTPFGTTLTYDDTGITHSNGTSLLFRRNASGQITRITDPKSQSSYYHYDSSNNLSSLSFPVSGLSKYSYDDDHRITEIIDPLNRSVLKNIYDDDGRLIAQEDADGNRTDFSHDIDGRQSIITDRLGQSTVFYYDDRGNVLSEVDALGSVTTYTYDTKDNQLTKTNALGFTETATYDDRYNQLTQTDGLGNTTAFSYNTRGQELTITDALGHRYNNRYDSYGNLLSIESPDGSLSGQSINAQGLVSDRTDAEGHKSYYSYSSKGFLLQKTDAEGEVITNTYDDNGNKSTSTVTRLVNGQTKSEKTGYYYDGENRLTQMINALGRPDATVYDKPGNIIKTRDVLSRATTMAYDAYGRLLDTTYPDGTTESNTYDAEGNQLSETDRKGRTTSYTYDALNRLTVTTYPNNSTTETIFDAIGQVIEEIDERGNSTTHTYDAAGRRLSTSDALNNTSTFEYDANGNLIKQTDAKGQVTEFVYNTLDQRTQTLFDDGSSIDSVYDKLGLQIETVDQNGRSTHFAYDGLGRLINVTDELDQVTSYTYDEVGNKLSQSDAMGRTTSWTYDALGRELSRTLPLGQVEDFTYDTIGNQTTHRDFNQKNHSFGYESDTDRLNQDNRFDGNTVSYSYDNTGLRSSATDSLGDYSYTYDDRDRLLQETKPDGSTLDYTYDAAGNKLSLSSTVNGLVTDTSYSYDVLNRLKTVTDASGITTYHYDEVGNRSAVDYSNSTRTEYSYNSLNQLTQVLHKDVLDNALASFDYTLDGTGRRTQIIENTGRVTDYSYDELYRLISETITDPVNGNYSASYEYDKVGNRTYATIDGVQTAYTYDDNDRLTQQGGTTYTYDDNGNTLSESLDTDQTTYQWDSNNRLIDSIARTSFGSTSSSFAYDMDDNRVSKTVDDNDTHSNIAYIVDNNQDYAQVLHEVDSTTLNTDVTYTYGDDLLSQSRAGQLQVYHYDGLGSTRLLTDSNGITTDAYQYEAFGDLLSQSGFSENNYLFTGEQFDDELGQYYLRARYYDQGVGRFTGMDEWKGNSGSPNTLNKYLYAGVDPANMIDPSGYFFTLGGASLSNSTSATLAATATTTYVIGQSLSNSTIPGGFTNLQTGWLTLAGMSAVSSNLFELISEKVDERNDATIELSRSVEDGELASLYSCNCFRLGRNAFPKQFFHSSGEAILFGDSFLLSRIGQPRFHLVQTTISVSLYNNLDHSAREPGIGPIVTVPNGLLPAFNFETERNGGWRYGGTFSQ